MSWTLTASATRPATGTRSRCWKAGWRRAREGNAAPERSGVLERVDHRTLVAQREAALKRACEARERGDEGEELHETVRAVSLDRPPLPPLSPGAWQTKARGIEVGRVAARHEARSRTAEVREIAAGLAREVRAWIAERVRERPGQGELALAGARENHNESGGRRASYDGRDGFDPRDLATRLGEAWEMPAGRFRQERTAEPEGTGIDAESRDVG